MNAVHKPGCPFADDDALFAAIDEAIASVVARHHAGDIRYFDLFDIGAHTELADRVRAVRRG